MVEFSIIVPLSKPNKFMEECIEHCLAQTENDFEMIILPDEDFSLPTLLRDKRITIIPTGKTGPAEKRDIGIDRAKGEYCAFIDDDAYPMKDWLRNAKQIFESDRMIGAVGGPAVTPKDDPFVARLSGAFYESKLGSGSSTYRYVPEKERLIDDFPSVNLIVRTDLLKRIDGFDSTFYPGEDTKLCLEIIKRGFNIKYSPTLLIYHRRRPSFSKHFKQLTNYATHRGYFAKRFPETSLRPIYLMPSAFLAFNLAGILSLFVYPLVFPFYAAAVLMYLLIAAALIRNDIVLRVLGAILTFFSHNAYGLWFLIGLTKKELKR